ncbi:phage tail collar domain-containing protein [Synechococcus phage S-CRM01]|uniref:tail fiber protein n=1 Tax=Synechococcus phage S-CRM01 TaxID=1026955 RepID=UPI000209E33A|nr:tail fiber protein [Synechococcus phage S-CRM01]AEC52963.1 phage tail collar domain-containing protein [Synechococcus phage S-CRM01]
MPLLDTDQLVVARSGTNYRMSAEELKTYAGGLAVVGPTAPSSPATGRLWYNTTSGRLNIFNGTAWVDASPSVGGGGSVAPGTVAFIAGNFAPAGWLKANGAILTRSVYSDLFAAIGTTFGAGNGSTTFAIPDLRGEFIRCWADGRAAGTWPEGSRVFGTFQNESFLNHGHGVNDPSHAHGVFDPGHTHGYARQDWGAPANIGIQYIVGQAQNSQTAPSGTGIGIFGNFTGISIQANGGNETRPRNIALLAIIKF